MNKNEKQHILDALKISAERVPLDELELSIKQQRKLVAAAVSVPAKTHLRRALDVIVEVYERRSGRAAPKEDARQGVENILASWRKL